jgi:predicted extracellular nuclease
MDANEVLPGPTLKFNPGRIEPSNEAWTASRKPLVAEWEVIGKNGKGEGKFFTLNVHFGSKGGSSSIQGDARPPVNGGVEDRLAQAELTANFVKVSSIFLFSTSSPMLQACRENKMSLIRLDRQKT